MFISTAEKNHLLDRVKLISALIKDVSDANTEITMLKAKIKVLEEKAQEIKQPKPTEAELKAELKKAQKRAYAKAYYQRKKERDQVFHVGS